MTPWTVAHQAPLSMEFSRQEYWSGYHSLLQEIFPTQGSNLCLLHLLCWRACLVTQSCLTLHDLMDCSPPGSSVHNDSPGKNTGVGCHALLQGVFPTKGVNVGLPHCRRILHHLSHKGSPRILEWVAYPFSRGSFQPRNRSGVSCIAGRFFAN